MDDRKKRALNKPYRLFCLLILLLCACTEVPEHCGDGLPRIDPFKQFCYPGGIEDLCNGKTFDPYRDKCLNGSIVPKESGTVNPPGVTTYTLTVNYNPSNAAGTVRVNDNDYTAPTSVSVSGGIPIPISAVGTGGYTFTNWTTNDNFAQVSETNEWSTTVSLSGDATIIANFTNNSTTLTPFTLTVNYNGAGTVKVNGDDYKTPVTVNDDGTPVNISAIAASGYTFTGWTKDGSSAQINNAGRANTTVLLSGDAIITAAFEAIPTNCDAAKNFCNEYGTVYSDLQQCSNAVEGIQYLEAKAKGAVCMSDGASFCQYSTGCYEMSSDYSGVVGVCEAGACTCDQVIAGCKKDGALYSGVTGLDASNNYGAGLKCTDKGGTLVGTPPPEACGGYCLWNSGCEAISTDPAGSYGPPITSCADAIANCDKDGARFDNSSCTGTQVGGNESCGGYCKWDTGCEEIKTDKKGDYGPIVETCAEAIAKCDADGARFDNSSCSGTQIGGNEACGN